jgi:nicotinamide-nucleotide amidase
VKGTIVAIGDELLIGQVINTNAAFIAEQASSVGIEIVRMTTVGDDLAAIVSVFHEAFSTSGVVLVTGGLGPTHDDITRKAVCEFFQTSLAPSGEARTHVEAFLKSRGAPWTAAAEDQTLIPRGANVIPNRHGTAPGEMFEREGKYFFVMPGVPYEMEAMVRDFIVPFFRTKATGTVILHRTLKTTGIAESMLSSRIGDIGALLRNEARLAFLPSPAGVRLRITVTARTEAAAAAVAGRIESAIREKAGKYIYAAGNEELEETVGSLLSAKRLTLAIAESCTGGLIAHRLTNVPGSSAYVERAVVTYSNASKTEVLHVPAAMIDRHGAVSSEVAQAMADGVRQTSHTDIGISTTGIAGPGGGSTEKPVGLVWIGYADARETLALKFHFGSNRLHIKERAAQAALDLIRRRLLSLD